MRLKNKVILMCGVGPGMGRTTALQFAQEGRAPPLEEQRREGIQGS